MGDDHALASCSHESVDKSLAWKNRSGDLQGVAVTTDRVHLIR
jgi:hypothetical protein